MLLFLFFYGPSFVVLRLSGSSVWPHKLFAKIHEYYAQIKTILKHFCKLCSYGEHSEDLVLAGFEIPSGPDVLSYVQLPHTLLLLLLLLVQSDVADGLGLDTQDLEESVDEC